MGEEGGRKYTISKPANINFMVNIMAIFNGNGLLRNAHMTFLPLKLMALLPFMGVGRMCLKMGEWHERKMLTLLHSCYNCPQVAYDSIYRLCKNLIITLNYK